jgi:hypothetical protein
MGRSRMASGPPRGGQMRGLGWASHRLRLLLLGIIGPAQLDDEHDPIVQLMREQSHTHGDVRLTS